MFTGKTKTKTRNSLSSASLISPHQLRMTKSSDSGISGMPQLQRLNEHSDAACLQLWFFNFESGIQNTELKSLAASDAPNTPFTPSTTRFCCPVPIKGSI